MRRILLITLYCACVCFSTRADDESPPAWTAWLHYGRHMTLIDSNGDTLREVDLPIPQGYTSLDYRSQAHVAVSNNGHLVAYLAEGTQIPKLLVVYDIYQEQIKLTYAISDHIANSSMFLLDGQLFNQQDTAFAFGYSFIRDNSYGWRIIVLDLAAGRLIYELSNTPSDNGVVEPDHATYWTPMIRAYQGTEIVFTLQESGLEGKSESIRWNTLGGDLQSDIIYPHLYTDTLSSTGEVLIPFEDERFPSEVAPPYLYGVYSTAQEVYDPLSRTRFPFFAAYGYPYFVQNGERVLISAASYISPSSPNVVVMTLVDRDGQVINKFQVPENMVMSSIDAVSNGFVYTTSLALVDRSYSMAIPAVYEVDTRDDQLDLGRVVWQISLKEFRDYTEPLQQPFFDIAWVHSDAPVGPFKPWAQLADPVYAPTPPPSAVTITPTLIPTPPPLFYVGQTVRVQTIDGEILNLRAQATRKSEIVVYIEDDTHLELLEGPVEAEGFSWWRVRLPDGLEGWVVENDGELQTLMPYSP